MLNTNFDSSIVTDFAPHGSLCEWCGKPGEGSTFSIWLPVDSGMVACHSYDI